jgi:hypothetical protein
MQEALSRAQPAFSMPTADVDRHAAFGRRSGHRRASTNIEIILHFRSASFYVARHVIKLG